MLSEASVPVSSMDMLQGLLGHQGVGFNEVSRVFIRRLHDFNFVYGRVVGYIVRKVQEDGILKKRVVKVLISIPIGGILDVSEIGFKPPKKKDKVLRYILMSPEVWPSMLCLYFGDNIRVDPLTHDGDKRSTVTQLHYLNYDQEVRTVQEQLVPSSGALLNNYNHLTEDEFGLVQAKNMEFVELLESSGRSRLVEILLSKDLRVIE